MDATTTHDTGATAEQPDISLSAVMHAADSLVSSPEPEVVFESLVRRCAPLVCDAATATVSRPDGRMYAATWPNSGFTHRSRPDGVVVDFNAPASGDYAGYHGLVSFLFRHQHGSGPFAVQLLVERAMANVERARLVEAATSRKTAAEHLEVALSSNREIGVAVGILMVNHKIDEEQAFDLLSRISQHHNRKVRLIALEVARTGMIELPPGFAVVERGRRKRRRLSSVPSAGRG